MQTPWSGTSLTANSILSWYYRRPAPRLLLPLAQELLPHNGPATNSYGPLLFFLAAVMRRTPDLEPLAAELLAPDDRLLRETVERALIHCDTPAARAILEQRARQGLRLAPAEAPHDVLAYGARGANSVNALWAHFFATGDAAALRAMIAALPSWHWVARQLRAEGRDPANTLIDGAGKSVQWSLKANAWQHERVRQRCAAERDDPRQPLAAREELALILAAVAERLRAEGPNPEEAAAVAFLAAAGGEEPPAEPADPPPAEPADPAPDLSWLAAHTPDAWGSQVQARYRSIEDLDGAIRGQERVLAADPPVRGAALRDLGALCLGARYLHLADAHLTAAAGWWAARPGRDARIEQAAAQIARLTLTADTAGPAAVEAMLDPLIARCEEILAEAWEPRPARMLLPLLTFRARRAGEQPDPAAMTALLSRLQALLDRLRAEGSGPPSALASGYHQLGTSYSDLGCYAEAALAFGEARTLREEAPGDPAERAWRGLELRTYRAVCLLRAGDPAAPAECEATLEALRALAAADPAYQPFADWAAGLLVPEEAGS